ncbi:uncharacterized protein LOC103519327 isoform X2 [Diaphorina citri]|uniref:Uncharacterized protein LOC103519327 isoform X1 n=1 Tax=Diaphorina citri TaxID=121845 RepID=A0A1S4EN91_DIACI|nr:uncharacterized protein LOC103519327 isoform X3 [Diaphorina citri]XP_026686666.1 uncharacterized protein LOC103519327 isoform X1 [Diaphorina citri]XP_026686667.1 uncharacterized protein LOC103519327 isoform X2 [Diaphorina citri]KAI5705077.1 hypothetical protein M8J75_011641 [Diaphorina citri]KAI5736951.1 hypothetical protein M8J76_008803 [Diaphorina citri]KAI5743616.1 hypothetical protein M8J77_020227 [Diaphorina citri]
MGDVANRYSTSHRFISINPPNPLTPMTSEDVVEWLNWLDEVTYVSDQWASWLQRTCDQAKVMSNKRKGLFVRPDGTKVNLSNVEWEDFKKKVDQESMHLRKTEVLILRRADAWDQKAKPKEQMIPGK